MVQWWAWCSELAFVTSFPLWVADKPPVALILCRACLNVGAVAWVFSTLPWVFLYVVLTVSTLLYMRASGDATFRSNRFAVRVADNVAYFSAVNFVLQLPSQGNNAGIITRIFSWLGVAGAAVIGVAYTVRNRLEESWNCYNPIQFPTVASYVHGVCPPLDVQDTPMCIHIPGIHCDTRFAWKSDMVYLNVATVLVAGAGVMYTLGCPLLTS